MKGFWYEVKDVNFMIYRWIRKVFFIYSLETMWNFEENFWDADTKKEFLHCIKNRVLEQKFVYFGVGAYHYYQWYGHGTDVASTTSSSLSHTKLDYNSFVYDTIKDLWIITLVSLWCWNWFQEKALLLFLHQKWCKVSYIGVDSSQSMIDLAKENLKSLPIATEFICWDFYKPEVRNLIQQKTKDSPKRLFSFMWKTISNTNQTNIVDSLYNMLWNEDLLWFECFGRTGDDNVIFLSLFDRYSWYLHNEHMTKFYLSPLEQIWIPASVWKLNIQTAKESSVLIFLLFLPKSL